ncbi:GlxA family transcriptional regulator [Pseudonocardia spinosispora]|uniref:GlxA family transcriptional regulator n=1 Tax=Pseudonocardia spinosispora TaxID=103441 RepID=UPI00041D6EDD|nr:helix-turn-helix domain-containing protein [Pseudonocardia spinosispora]
MSRARTVATRPHRIAILAVPQVIGYDLAIPAQLFSGATGRDGQPLYEVRVCGLDRLPIPTTVGYQLVPELGPEGLDSADTVIIPGTDASGPRQHGSLDERLAAALRRIPGDARLMSICTGAFVLAAAGVLDGRRATTHWSHTERFRELYPAVTLDESVLYVDEGDVLTSAGLGAGVDLCLHVLRSDHGVQVANAVARYCVVPAWRDGGQSQFIDRPVPEPHSGTTEPTRSWALQHLDEALTLAELAAHAHLSVRTFNRRFRAETGLSPHTWLTRHRIQHARHLLETTDLPVDQVASAAGLGSAATLRHHLGRSLGVPPLAYRRTFRSE